MSEYKLVPVEPTPEMLEAGADWCGQGLGTDEAKGRAATAYKSMLAAAPVVQGDPVGYVSPRILKMLRSGKACGITMADKPDAHNGVTVPLYAAPQPVEQQPEPGVTLLLELLSHARCNTCDGSGGLYDNHGQPHQCQWCRERSEALAAHRKQETSHENQ